MRGILKIEKTGFPLSIVDDNGTDIFDDSMHGFLFIDFGRGVRQNCGPPYLNPLV